MFGILTLMVANATLRGGFEERLKKIIKFCKRNSGNIILFIDEVHMLYKLGGCSETSQDAMNVLKSYLSNDDIIMIGTTTKKEYTEYMAQDETFCLRLEVIELLPLLI